MNETGSALASALVGRPDFLLGGVSVRPSTRTISGNSGSAQVEPRVMQVLLALYDAGGGVLSREDLLQKCWAGVIVGDDAINRTIGEIRKAARETGASFGIETIPRVGYRLTGLEDDRGGAASDEKSSPIRIDRRLAVLGGLTALVGVGGIAAALSFGGRGSEVDALIERGRILQANGEIGSRARANAVFRSAIDRDPERADAWGWFARTAAGPDEARAAAQRALEIDQREPNARAVLIFQRRDLVSWVEWEDALLAVLKDDPDNTLVLDQLTFFYQGVGLCEKSWATNERGGKLEPFNPGNVHRAALKHWIFGRIGQSDKVADQAMRLWPRDPFVWNARLMLYAFTDRAPAALALLEDGPNRPANLTVQSIESWRAALQAIDTRLPSDISNAVRICTASAKLAPGLAANAILVFSYLGQMDPAYEVAQGLFEARGKVVQQSRGAGIRDLYSNVGWGRTQFLFVPAAASFREDGRFTDLCERMGHMAYWQERNVWPDPSVRGSLRLT